MEGVRELRKAVELYGVKAATAFPAGCVPQVPINDRKFYPLYAACVDRDIPIFVCAGLPGPRGYSTSAFAPCWYPRAIVEFANTRGADEIPLRGVLPDGAHARSHLRRAAAGAVPRPRVAEILARGRGAGAEALTVESARSRPRQSARSLNIVVEPFLGGAL